MVIRHASALNYEVKKPRSKQKELADVLKNKRFVRDKKGMVTANVFISVEKSENNVKNSEHVVLAKQMVDEEQIPRERPSTEEEMKEEHRLVTKVTNPVSLSKKLPDFGNSN